MSEILSNIGIYVICEHCETEFEMSADVVAESQDLMEGGCPGDTRECPARLFSNFVDRDALRDLADAWERVRESLHAPAVDVTLASRPTLETNLESEREERANEPPPPLEAS